MPMRILDPTLDADAEAPSLAPPLSTLEGTVFGLLDNAKIGTERFFDFLAEMLSKQYGVREFIRCRKPDTTRPVPREMLLSMRSADAVISAVGD